MAQPAKDQRLEQISSTEFPLSLNTARLTGQNVRAFFQNVFEGTLHL
jgi:hypothetical protein